MLTAVALRHDAHCHHCRSMPRQLLRHCHAAVLIRLPFYLISFAFWLAAPAVAHPGGVNSQGCHTNRKTKEYHCHDAKSSGSSSTKPVASPAPAASAPSKTPSKQGKKVKAVAVSAGPVTLVSVGDGDTIRVMTSNAQKVTIRLACIDAPETAQGKSGQDATNTLQRLLTSGGQLTLKPQVTDKYGRTVAEVFVDGQNVNLAMVRLGAAYAYRKYLKGCDASAYLQAESTAEQWRYGVWGLEGEQRPWDFRRSR